MPKINENVKMSNSRNTKITKNAKYHQKNPISQKMQKIEENAKTQKSPIMPNIAKNAKFHHKLQNCPKFPNRKITKNSKYHQKCQKSQKITKITENHQK